MRVYVDASVFGGVHDREFAEPSRSFFRQVADGQWTVLISELVVAELAGAPQAIRHVLDTLPFGAVEEIPLNEEARRLSEAYLDAAVLSKGSSNDALHVAAATVARADLILSWNFRHIVNFRRMADSNFKCNT
jgi:predicted nucleic acid-binding protein